MENRLTNLKVLRLSRFENQGEIAKIIGVSRPWYNLIESGRLLPLRETQQNLEKLFGLPYYFLIQEFDVGILKYKAN